MTARETYAAARARLLSELAKRGWDTRPRLKRPYAECTDGVKVVFRAQSVYLNRHSLFLDYRGMSVGAFVQTVHALAWVRAR